MKITTIRLGILQTNCYVLEDSADNATVVDPGGLIDELQEYINNNHLRVDKIVLTHGHADHIAGAMAASRAFACPVYVHQADLPWLSGKDDPMARHLGLKEDVVADVFLKEGDVISLASVLVHPAVRHEGRTVPRPHLDLPDLLQFLRPLRRRLEIAHPAVAVRTQPARPANFRVGRMR